MTRLIRLIVLFTILVLVVGVLAPLASAQKDPFAPLVQPESDSAPGANGQPPAPAPQSPTLQPTPLPRTGVDALPYLVLATASILVGLVFIRLDRWVSAPA